MFVVSSAPSPGVAFYAKRVEPPPPPPKKKKNNNKKQKQNKN